MPTPPLLEPGEIAVVAPRNMCFSAKGATSIDLHIHETVRWSEYRDQIVVFTEEVDDPFDDVSARFWPTGARTSQIVDTVHRNDPAAIVVHQHLPTATALAKACQDVPVALIRHNFQKPPRNAFSRFFKRRQFDSLAAIGFVSECCSADFAAMWPGVRTPVHLVLNGIDGQQWQSAQVKDPLVLFVGRMAPEKGTLEAAQALVTALDKAPSEWRGQFVVTNAPEHSAYARTVQTEIEKANGRIALMSDLRHDAVRDLMARAAIVLAPTQNREPFGRVAIEALASGAVLIASARGGFVEIVGDAGVLLDNPDAASITEALRFLMSDEHARSRLSAMGRDRAVPRYSLANAAATFDDLVRSLLSARP